MSPTLTRHHRAPASLLAAAALALLALTACDAGAPTAALPGGMSADRAPVPFTQYTLNVGLGHTVIAQGGRMWTDADGGTHARKLPVTDDLIAADGSTMGTLSRKVSFNIQPGTGASVAWCSFTMTFTDSGQYGGPYSGSCNGSLLEGHFEGAGANGSSVRGEYTLNAGGRPAVGPYSLDVTVSVR